MFRDILVCLQWPLAGNCTPAPKQQLLFWTCAVQYKLCAEFQSAVKPLCVGALSKLLAIGETIFCNLRNKANHRTENNVGLRNPHHKFCNC